MMGTRNSIQLCTTDEDKFLTRDKLYVGYPETLVTFNYLAYTYRVILTSLILRQLIAYPFLKLALHTFCNIL